ncbi:MAG TPA: long-chain-fatty-acid--CoA ligase [Woeseiaceae bacterium]|nr:long-chain-fatty-acid--CoA ligase [Woeseiaceae bacterium]
MNGLMMDRPLLISSIARHADRFHHEREIVSVTVDDPLHRTSWGTVIGRARQLANALGRLGLKQGDRVATLAWNDHRHLEIYYAVSGAGFVCHTINPRLFPEQLIFILNHAEDRWLFIDPLFMPLLEKLAAQVTGLEGVVVLTDEAHMPATNLENVHCYESFIAAEKSDYEWPDLDENAASALCYTSGTTGDPKGVLYSHRSTLLHAYAVLAPDVMGLSCRDSVLPVVPLFHVNAWGVPYAAAMCGAKLVLPGPKMADGEVLYRLMDSEDVNLALGVPTVWLALLQYTEKAGKRLDKLERTIIGGAAVPRMMIEAFRDRHGVEVRQGWGMTEMSPVGTVNTLKAGMELLSPEEKLDIGVKAGRGLFGCELRVMDDEGRELPWDGKSYGALQVRGPWVCSDYFKLEGNSESHTADGWFGTGDVAIIDAEGFVTITDRTKDVIKSGGEWISSIELENVIMSHPSVASAAVIGIAHEKWGERPLLVVVRKENANPGKQELLEFFNDKVVSWWIPNDVAFIDELPLTATGKIKKLDLRKQFADYRFPD